MIVQFKERHPNVRAIVGDMGSLTGINENSFDFVISTFSAFSFTDDIALTVKEIKRVLKPDGKIMITGLGKYSLRRLLLLRFGDAEVYKTRGSTHQMYTKAWVFSKKNLMSKFSFENFTSIKVEGYNAFGGLPLLTKFPSTWRISKLLSQLIPNISHELIITAKINKS
jgi:ubiquinone/menaquinone biosynthesis C-methylase UbiE